MKRKGKSEPSWSDRAGSRERKADCEGELEIQLEILYLAVSNVIKLLLVIHSNLPP